MIDEDTLLKAWRIAYDMPEDEFCQYDSDTEIISYMKNGAVAWTVTLAELTFVYATKGIK